MSQRTNIPPLHAIRSSSQDPFAALSHKRPRIVAITVTARRPLTAQTQTGRTLTLVRPEDEPAKQRPVQNRTRVEPASEPEKLTRADRKHRDQLMAIARQRIEQENRKSATLSPDDARQIVAMRIARALEGGRAAILTPDIRHDIVTEARRMGLRPFDANLIIAIVQDRARCAQPTDQIASDSRIRLVRGAGTNRGGLTGTGHSEASAVGTPSEMVAACIAFGTAVAAVTLLISWTLGIWPA
ncbi:MAG: hypothetical protein ACNA8P_05405 [Phycisphaerales bacterium]